MNHLYNINRIILILQLNYALVTKVSSLPSLNCNLSDFPNCNYILIRYMIKRLTYFIFIHTSDHVSLICSIRVSTVRLVWSTPDIGFILRHLHESLRQPSENCIYNYDVLVFFQCVILRMILTETCPNGVCKHLARQNSAFHRVPSFPSIANLQTLLTMKLNFSMTNTTEIRKSAPKETSERQFQGP